ncbi:PREDICTED: growth arrest and DNA damage-inducible proteins-interacting protein 1 [Trachymyrmex cornetzi]|uniref:Large ribosomal subunit protein mL64 n=1 Tax=Trachymyrmex cornetzi TaxID=471704 RepID=A0A195DR34_9HYME|nr:PREDICTED: growth arrest and DNA damage-inducible proteins-interacting protein 1 [Trachymyrmex cornetzi]XP_018369092.1 PREDICTED: growth arrest and DNA damage-inducible proteins-interacting protein 1 [Trachymyrmex cornetzi]KYN15272.1 Growth arrest and DNA damage-inducible proteins-interacting protein 1 [Trachymyrmex cornetzi]
MSLRRWICDVIVQRNVRFQGAVVGRFLATEAKNEDIDITTADEQPIYSDEPQYQEKLTKQRNKSRLSPRDRNVLMGKPPYEQPIEWYHNTVRYKKRMLGRYGFEGNEEPVGFAWPTPEEVKILQEYERVAFPISLQERWKELEEKKRIKAEKIKAREDKIAEKLSKVDQWIVELNARVAKKEAEMEAARLRKERMVEEIRQHFGFRISPHDERFKTMLEQKEKEERKKKKEAKKKAKEEKLKSMIQKMNQEQETDSTKPVE